MLSQQLKPDWEKNENGVDFIIYLIPSGSDGGMVVEFKKDKACYTWELTHDERFDLMRFISSQNLGDIPSFNFVPQELTQVSGYVGGTITLNQNEIGLQVMGQKLAVHLSSEDATLLWRKFEAFFGM